MCKTANACRGNGTPWTYAHEMVEIRLEPKGPPEIENRCSSSMWACVGKNGDRCFFTPIGPIP